jgi:hypothetical protein
MSDTANGLTFAQRLTEAQKPAEASGIDITTDAQTFKTAVTTKISTWLTAVGKSANLGRIEAIVDDRIIELVEQISDDAARV